jgi:hypothetical protein
MNHFLDDGKQILVLGQWHEYDFVLAYILKKEDTLISHTNRQKHYDALRKRIQKEPFKSVVLANSSTSPTWDTLRIAKAIGISTDLYPEIFNEFSSSVFIEQGEHITSLAVLLLLCKAKGLRAVVCMDKHDSRASLLEHTVDTVLFVDSIHNSRDVSGSILKRRVVNNKVVDNKVLYKRSANGVHIVEL